MVHELQQPSDLAARLQGDNTVASGIRDGAWPALRASLDRFVPLCPLEKVFYVQFSDRERFDPPLSPAHPLYQEDFPPALTWSRHMRVRPPETEFGAYLPIADIARAWLVGKGGRKASFRYEIFDWRMRDESRRPAENARRAFLSWENLIILL
ncbi:uncharacterized protein BJX67DRAFT_379613 [Aspergillus lucknowensis]|uniref:Uncharacterized protein n=1 Tax=Aspergillus lucknowensis TaxID=176173 RepID=A0ABR4LX70_9EURO